MPTIDTDLLVLGGGPGGYSAAFLAADRGIRVMPEFDVPGHTVSWFPGYPNLTVGKGPFEIARTWGTFVPTMDPTRETTYTFLDAFIGEGQDPCDFSWNEDPV